MEGIQEVSDVLTRLVPRHAINILRATVGKLASDVAKEVKAATPIDSGDLKKSIHLKRRKVRRGIVAVEVQGLFYWWFIENGTLFRPAQPFVGPVVDRLTAEIDTRFSSTFQTKLDAAVTKELKKRAIKK